MCTVLITLTHETVCAAETAGVWLKLLKSFRMEVAQCDCFEDVRDDRAAVADDPATTEATDAGGFANLAFFVFTGFCDSIGKRREPTLEFSLHPEVPNFENESLVNKRI